MYRRSHADRHGSDRSVRRDGTVQIALADANVDR
jgi:hypothetical protein